MKKVIITGVTGQDGSYMVDYLLENTDYEIYGIVRRLSVPNHKNLSHIDNPRFHLLTADITDSAAVNKIVSDLNPDYFINFAANSFVGNSWDMPYNHMETNFMSVLHQLDSIVKYAKNCRYYFAGSSEMFGDVAYTPQDEKHPLRPRSPYGVSKCAAHLLVKVYRESYGLYAVSGQLFNHESPRRPKEFLPSKCAHGVVRIKKTLDKNLIPQPLELGNFDAKRDWSHAKDFVRGVWLMLNQEAPKDYVLSSGETHSIRELVELAFACVGIGGKWVGSGLDEVFQDENANILVKVNKDFFRPAEVDLLLGDSTLARKELGWKPEYEFHTLIFEMVHNAIYEYEKV